MNARRIGLCCLLSLLVVTGCEKRAPVAGFGPGGPGGSQRSVHIITAPDGRSCEVDYPVVFIASAKSGGNNPHIKWHSDDNAYTVQFVSYTSGPNDTPPNTPGPNPPNPFDPSTDRVSVPGSQDSGNMKISDQATGYYMYRILDANGKTCKEYTDDRDTGVNVKR